MVTGKLKAVNVAREKRPGTYGDGGGLYLQVTASGAKSWIFRYWVAERDPATGGLVRDPVNGKVKGRSREMGLGSFATVSLAEARDRALECRKLREKEIDPIEAREAARQEAALDLPQNINFAVKTGAVRDFLDNSAVSYQTADSKVELKTADIASKARAYTMLISCTAKAKD